MDEVEPTTERPDGLHAVSALGEPTRRALYEYVAETGTWVSRDEAADAVGLERGTAAHHLDRLAREGLVDVEYRRLTGRQGPGAGRPAKLYRRARRDVQVTLPPRDYQLAGQMLAEALDRARAGGIDVVDAVDAVAAERGQELAEEIRAKIAGARGVAGKRRALLGALAEHGFEPCPDADGTIVLRNCPFHQLAQQHTELICGMNHCMLGTAVDGVGDARLRASLEPEEGVCCVKLRPSG
jgi:predicted ArsR family transcriptional regulator